MKDNIAGCIFIVLLYCLFLCGRGCTPTISHVDEEAGRIVNKEAHYSEFTGMGNPNYAIYTIKVASDSFPDNKRNIKLVMPNSFGDVGYRVIYTNDTIIATK